MKMLIMSNTETKRTINFTVYILLLLSAFDLGSQVPNWTVNPSLYPQKMTVYANIADDELACVISDSTNNIIGVFDLDGEIRGLKSTNSFISPGQADIQVGSKNGENGIQLFFKVYDVKTDKVYNISDTVGVFVSSGQIGEIDFPITLKFDSDPIASAGPAQEIFNKTSTTLDATGSGEWSIIEGQGGMFSNINDPKAIFSGILDESYLLVWTLDREEGDCLAESGEVRIIFVLPEPENFLRTCSDGLDNDGDGLWDCDDPDCGKPDITSFDITTPTPLDCSSTLANGILKIVQTGGDTFSINEGIDFSPLSTFVNVTSGFYDVAVMNTLTSCRTDTIAHVINTAELVTTTQDQVLDCILDANTPLTVEVSNGTLPYMFAWEDDKGTSYDNEAPVDVGSYYVTVTDQMGCVKSDSLEVSRSADPLEGFSTDFLSGPQMLCMGISQVEYNLSINPGNNQVDWNYPSGDVSIAEVEGGKKAIIDFGTTAKSKYLGVSVSNYCSGLQDSILIDYAIPYLCDTYSNCPDTAHINSGLLLSENAPQVYQVSNSMTLNAKVPESIYQFNAGESIVFQSGFEVPLGGLMIADINTCNN